MNPKNRTVMISVLLAAAAAAAAFFLYPADNGRIVTDMKFFMGTVVQIKVSVDKNYDGKKVNEAIGKAFEEFARIENLFSVYKEDSEISKINRLRKNERLHISDETFELIRRSVDYSKMTDGAFDITVKPLVDLWKEAKAENLLPTEESVKLALAHTGYEKIVLNKPASTITFTREDMSIDLGGIAKGYATARAVKILEENGIKNAVVSSGGDVYCLGKKSGGERWKVGVQHPRDRNSVFLEIFLKDKAIDTSGDYERYFTLNGKRYSHIIDPRTGYPTGDDVISSTVITRDPTEADALATALAVLCERGIAIIESIEETDAVLILKRGDKLYVRMTTDFKKRYDLTEKDL